ncbi:MAG TPA: septal ring lytic transglycosylase RlpA family protein [Stellaceae bacterium]|nr:septal ring lytic transglycosylase RlpA family protein [Stellaceae bacterium]
MENNRPPPDRLIAVRNGRSNVRTANIRTAEVRSSESRQAESRQAEPRRAKPVALHTVALPPPDQYLGSVRVIGRREIGSAAWYGGYHVGRRTASGDLLDAVHATAAHRSLPLNSMVRVTNLTNGRSVIAKINDRGPVSHSLLIDVSPNVADRLDMRRAGIVRVSVEPVALAH